MNSATEYLQIKTAVIIYLLSLLSGEGCIFPIHLFKRRCTEKQNLKKDKHNL